jgi:hypothetical protein
MVRLNPAQLVLGAICAGFAILLGYLLVAPLPEVSAPPVVHPRAAAAVHKDSDDDDSDSDSDNDNEISIARFDAPPKQAFSEVDDRLVFNPARTRVVAPSQPGASNATSLPSDLSLVGVILDDSRKLALFKSPTAPLAVGVELGGSIEGWQVMRIEPDRVALRAGGPEQELKLSSNKAPPPGPSLIQPHPFGPPNNFPRPPNFARNNPNANQGPNGNNNNGNNNNNNNNDDNDDNDDN